MFKVISTIDREKKKNRKKNHKASLYITVRGLMKKKRGTQNASMKRSWGIIRMSIFEEIRKKKGKGVKKKRNQRL